MLKNWFARSALIVCLLCSSAFTCSLADLLQQTVSTAPATNSAQSDLNAQIQAVIDANLEASRTEDIAAYMLTIHPDSPAYSMTESTLVSVFATYDLDYSVVLSDVTLLDNGDASVPFVLTTKRVGGAAFRDNEVTGVFVLRLDGAAWKVYSQGIQNVRYLT